MQIAQLRLAHQHLVSPQHADPASLLRHFGAMQAQDYTYSKWAIGCRLTAATDASVEVAIDSGQIIRTHLMRPTWHWVAAEDVRWMLELTAPQIRKASGATTRERGVNAELVSKTNRLIERALAGGQYLTRPELVADLARHGVAIDSGQATHVMMYAELDGVVCNGPRRGKQNTYALLDEWAPARGPVYTRPEALAELARRYFTSHGPATLADFVWWSGLNVGDARAGLEAAKHHLVQDTYEGQTYWWSALAPPAGAPAVAYLLAAFDEFTIAYRDRSAVLNPTQASNTISSNGVFWPIVVVRGQVVGRWKCNLNLKKPVLEHDLFHPLDVEAATAVQAMAERYVRFEGKTSAPEIRSAGVR